MTGPCPGACNAAWRAAGGGPVCGDACRHYSCGTIKGCWACPGDPVWCRDDAARIRRALTDLDDLAALRALFADGHHPQTRDPARGGDPPSPSPAADDLTDLQGWLLDWDDAYREWHNRRYPGQRWLYRPRRGVLATIRLTTISWLCDHLDGILASDLALDFGAEVLHTHRVFRDKTRAGTGMHLGLVPCAHCKLRLLAWADGDDHLRCGGCGRWMSREDYDAELAGAARQLEDA